MKAPVRIEYLGLPFRLILLQPPVVPVGPVFTIAVTGYDYWMVRFVTGDFSTALAAGDSILMTAEAGTTVYCGAVLDIPAVASRLGGFYFGVQNGNSVPSVACAEISVGIPEALVPGDGRITMVGGTIATSVQFQAVSAAVWAWREAWGVD